MTGGRSRLSPWEWLGLSGLAALAAFLLATSWRRWPDPLVDFGRELYVPWRLSNGALLYRDADDIYGPLSQYLNAGLFRIAGPGLMTLVAANLAVFAGILATAHLLVRRAWGAGAAFAATAVFLAVFGFSQFLGIGNYNYATPYSHEATHGLLACLALVAVAAAWVEEPTPARSGAAGLLLGICAVLKPEILLAAAGVAAAALVLRLRRGGGPGAAAVAAGAAGLLLPTAAFAAYFALHVPLRTALAYTCRAWLYVSAGAGFTSLSLQDVFLGTDHPAHNLAAAGRAVAQAAAVLGALSLAAWFAGRRGRAWTRALCAAVAAAAVLWFSWTRVDWIDSGRGLLGLDLVVLARAAWPLVRGKGAGRDDRASTIRVLLAVLGAALMARMVLNGRIYHYGFYQAPIAAVVVVAAIAAELPRLLADEGRSRPFLRAGLALFLVPGLARITAASQDILRSKTHAVGSGRDLFYAFPPQQLATGDIVRVVSEWLRTRPAGQTAVVLPEGEMMNYLARVPSPVAPYAYFAAATSGGREQRIVADLERHPPDWVVLVSRDISDNGVKTYGESVGDGLMILNWVADRYDPVMSVGGDPLDPRQCGAVVFGRKGARPVSASGR
jgi:hypothetical protein